MRVRLGMMSIVMVIPISVVIALKLMIIKIKIITIRWICHIMPTSYLHCVKSTFLY